MTAFNIKEAAALIKPATVPNRGAYAPIAAVFNVYSVIVRVYADPGRKCPITSEENSPFTISVWLKLITRVVITTLELAN